MRTRRELAGTAVAFGAPLILYLCFATRTLQGGDVAEFALLAVSGGVAHPPGYPLWTLLARMAGALPFGTPAWRAAIPSAIAGAAAVGVVYGIGLRLTQKVAPSLAAALAFAVAPLAWKMAGVPEVFSLLAVFAAGAVLAAMRAHDAIQKDAVRWAHVLGWVAGLGMANHHTLILCAPVFAWGLANATWRMRPIGALLAFAAGVAFGLLPYALLPAFAATAGEDGFIWGDPRSLRGVVDHVLRREYGTFRLSVAVTDLRPIEHGSAFLVTLPSQLFWVYLLVAAGGIVVLWRGRAHRGLVIALLASVLLSGVLFPALFNLPSSPIADAVAERFLLLPLVMVAPFLAPGLALATRGLSPSVARALPFLPLPFATLVALPHARWSADPTVERYLSAAVGQMEPGAVVVGDSDVINLGTRWIASVRGERKDVQYLDLNLVRRRWYYDEARARIPGFTLPFETVRTHLGDLVEDLAEEHPVYVTVWLAPRLGERHVPQPAGFFARVPRPAPLPLADVEASLMRATAALGDLPARPVDAWSSSYRDAARLSWGVLANNYDAVGDTAGAARSRAAAASIP